MDMYQRVVEDSIEFPSYFDPVTIDFISGVSLEDIVYTIQFINRI